MSFRNLAWASLFMYCSMTLAWADTGTTSNLSRAGDSYNSIPVDKPKLVIQLGHGGLLLDGRFSSYGKTILTSSRGKDDATPGSTIVWDTTSHRMLAFLPHPKSEDFGEPVLKNSLITMGFSNFFEEKPNSAESLTRRELSISDSSDYLIDWDEESRHLEIKRSDGEVVMHTHLDSSFGNASKPVEANRILMKWFNTTGLF